MKRHVIGLVQELPPGTRKRVAVDGRGIAIFNDRGTFYALRDICPHRGAQLSDGTLVSAVTADAPGCYTTNTEQRLVKCPWHGWEFDLASGQSWCDPVHERVRAYDVSVQSGAELAESPDPSARVPGPYVADTVEISIEGAYVVVTT